MASAPAALRVPWAPLTSTLDLMKTSAALTLLAVLIGGVPALAEEPVKRTLYVSPVTKEEPLRTYYLKFARRLEEFGAGDVPKENGKSQYGARSAWARACS